MQRSSRESKYKFPRATAAGQQSTRGKSGICHLNFLKIKRVIHLISTNANVGLSAI